MLRFVRGAPLSLLLAIAALCLHASPACAQTDGAAQTSDAQDDEARALFTAGRVAFADGRFADALEHFRRSHELSGRPELLFNIGSAADRLRRNEEALEAFRGYLREVPDASNRPSVEARIEVLERAVATDAAAAAAAAQEPAGAADPALIEDPEEPSTPVTKRWWFWTALLAVAAGSVLAAVLATRSDGSALIEGDDGMVVFTLGSL